MKDTYKDSTVVADWGVQTYQSGTVIVNRRDRDPYPHLYITGHPNISDRVRQAHAADLADWLSGWEVPVWLKHMTRESPNLLRHAMGWTIYAVGPHIAGKEGQDHPWPSLRLELIDALDKQERPSE